MYGMGIRLGNGAVILTECRFAKGRNVIIGEGSVINNHCFIDNRGKITVGRNSSISIGTWILTMGHDIESPEFRAVIKEVSIGSHVWICARCIIQPGVVIGDGAVVLPGTVVCKDVSPFSIVGGVPARIVGSRKLNPNYVLNWNPIVPPFG